MNRTKHNSGLILPAAFIKELKGVLKRSQTGYNVTPRQIKWLDGLLENYGLNVMEPEDIGAAYEQVHLERKERKKQGIFYTPKEIVDTILNEAFDGWCASNPGEVPRLLEPSCGAGAFALGILERIDVMVEKNEESKLDFIKTVSSILNINDIDENALPIAMLCILRKLEKLGHNIEKRFSLNATRKDFLDVDAWIPGDANEESADQFDVIIGNPPYISFYAKGSQGISEDQRAEWAKHFISARGRVNTYLLFLEMALKLLSPGGRLGFIIPNTFLIMKSYEKLRRHVLDNCHLRFISDLSTGVFPGAQVPCCIIVLEKRHPEELKFDENVIVLRKGADLKQEKASLDTAYFRKLPYFMFNVGLEKRSCAIIDKMESGAEQLKVFIDVRDGINPANIKSKIMSSEKEGPTFKPVLVGRDIHPYNLDWSGQFVNYNPSVVDEAKGEYCFFREERIFLTEKKLVHRQTARRLIAALDKEQFYALNSCHLSLIEDDRLDIMYLLALYNSDILNFYYSTVFRDTEKVFPQVKTANIEKLPLKFGDPETLADIVAKATKLHDNGLDSKAMKEVAEGIEEDLLSVYGLTEDQHKYMRGKLPK